jgi:peptidoglycan/xylan/chitin deacetylase (PgdA/CDA1 family)
VLAHARTNATFFLLGSNVERHRNVAVRIAREGHTLGNHTWSHARPGAISEADFAREIARTDALLEDVAREASIPLANPIPVRLPYGVADGDPRVAWLAQIGRVHVGWTADFADWEPGTDARELADRIRRHVALHPDAVLDLHDSSRDGARRDATVEAVRLLLLT